MSKKSILLMLDTDPRASVFDRVVAVDAGAEELFSYAAVTPNLVAEFVRGLIFTRGPADLHRSAVFVGGSDVHAATVLAAEVKKHLLPDLGLRVSVLLDPSGANTTAAAAVLLAAKHQPLKGATAVILGGTGPVGLRAARLLARQGAIVRIGSRSKERADAAASSVRMQVPGAVVTGSATASSGDGPKSMDGAAVVIAAGAAGLTLLPRKLRLDCPTLKVAIDLNAVPPAGIEGVEPSDKGTDRDGVAAYGALGVGGFKMKIHRRAVAALFERNDHFMDAEEVYALGEALL